MAFRLGPGGQVVLVLLGLALVYAGIDRAGVLPAGAPHVFPPRPAPERPAHRLSASDFAWAAPDGPCRLPLRVATTERVAAAALVPQDGILFVDVVDGPEEIASRLRSGGAGGAVMSVSELAAEWKGLSGISPRVARVLSAGDDLGILSDRASTGQSRVAAVPASAAEFQALAAAARAGESAHLLSAPGSQAAAAALDRGEADAAAAPLQVLLPRLRSGRGTIVTSPRPLDPVVLVVSSALASCAADPTLAPHLSGSAEGRLARARALFPDPALDLTGALAAEHFDVDSSGFEVAWDAAVHVRGVEDAPRASALLLPGAR